MRKILFVLCGALLFATSCLNGGNTGGSSSATYPGYLTVTDLASGEVTYSDDKASVEVCIPNMLEAKFNITFNGIKFSPMMPKLNIDLLAVPFTTTVSEDETTLNYVFDVKNIVPEVGGIEYQKYKVDRLWGQVGRPVEILFTMESKGSKVHFTTHKNSEESNGGADATE